MVLQFRGELDCESRGAAARSERLSQRVLPMTCTLAASLLLAASFVCPSGDELPDPDGKPADTGKPVKVFVLLGQSNMLGFGKVAGEKEGTLELAVKEEGLYPFLVDDQGAWTMRKDVRNVRVIGGARRRPCTPTTGSRSRATRSGPRWASDITTPRSRRTGARAQELHRQPQPRLGLRSTIPGSLGYEFEDGGKTWVYAGSGESPHLWEKGTEPKKIGWYAGKQYDDDVANAKKVLAKDHLHLLPERDPLRGRGLFGGRETRTATTAGTPPCTSARPLRLIDALRADFDAPEAKPCAPASARPRRARTASRGRSSRR